MKNITITRLLIALIASFAFAFAGCEDSNGFDETGDAIKDAGDATGDAVDDAGDEIQDATN